MMGIYIESDHAVLSISIVLFKPDSALLTRTLRSVRVAVGSLRALYDTLPVCVWFVNNEEAPLSEQWGEVFKGTEIQFERIQGQGNIGYGRAHNLAIERTRSRYHLILNPDVELAEDALVQALHFFDAHPEIALIAPHVSNQDGTMQYLCRRYPAVFDLGLRGFAPAWMRARFRRRLARYELRDRIDAHQTQPQTNAATPWFSPLLVSGCFMMFRTDALKKLGGFDPRYFLYFEDYDLSLRTHAIAGVAYTPAVRIRHFGGNAAKKGLRHIAYFIVSAFRFFSRFGWKWV